MNSAYLIKQNLDLIQRRWKWLKFGQHLGTAGAVLCLYWFVVELAAWRGIVSTPAIFYLLAALLVMASFLALVVVGLIVVAGRSNRAWLARSLEEGCPPLMDRVNTLVYLERNPKGVQMFPLKRRIEEQAAQVFQRERAANPFSPERMLIHLGMFAFALLAVIAFQLRFAPFARLLAPPEKAAVAKPDSPFELAGQNVTETAEKKTWGEVRIVDPGRDVKLTKIDVLPLQIEMATSDTMQNPVWVTSINGQAETIHPLGTAPDPHYAVYQPMIYLDELKVTEWDMISYYAKVQTGAPAEYASKMNFIEIRPFREDIMKSMNDKDGSKKKKAYGYLNELTGLIKQQTEVLQQTHAHQQTAYATDELRVQDTKKLTGAEGDLAVATNHLFAEIVSENENGAIAEMLDQLTGAEQDMDHATEALRDDVIPEGKQKEQSALTHLIASRKAFQKELSSGAFGGGGSHDDDGSDDVVAAGESKKAMSQVTELHDRDKAALDALHKLVQKQKSLADEAGADRQKQQTGVKNDLHHLMADNPDLFRGAEPEENAVQENMTQALLQMSSNDDYGARRYIVRAGESMGDLEKVVNKNHQAQQLAQAYALKKIIDQTAKQLGQEQAKPGSLSGDEVKSVADTAKQSTGTLKEIADSMKGAGDSSFGPELGQALSGQNQQSLDEALQQFSQAQDGAQRGSAAGSAQQGLQKISQAFQQSQPALTKQVRGSDQFQVAPGDSLDQATQQLQSLIAALQNNHKASPADEAKAESEILHNIQAGLLDPKMKDSPAKTSLIAQATELLKKPGQPGDPEKLKKLLDQIEAVRIEANDIPKDKRPEAETTFVDPSKYPPTYRDRIKTYFEQLSGQSK